MTPRDVLNRASPLSLPSRHPTAHTEADELVLGIHATGATSPGVEPRGRVKGADIAVIERGELATARDFASAIAQRWQDSVVAIIDVGKLLLGAKESLPHGEFGPMIESAKVPFTWNTAHRLMAIANHSILANCAHGHNLPSSWRTVYELTKVPGETLKVWLGDGTIHAEIQRSEVAKLLRQLAREETYDPGPIEGKYRVFYADPPWQYSDRLVESYGAAEHHYPTLSLDQLCGEEDLPNGRTLPAMIDGASAKDAVLFLWVTSPLLNDAQRVIESWGFEYKSSFIWDKVKHNYGHYNSVRHEVLLIAVRGSCLPDEKKLHDSVVSIERTGRHSEKPEYFRQLIDRLYPHGNRLELFAREEHEGWKAWGNEWK